VEISSGEKTNRNTGSIARPARARKTESETVQHLSYSPRPFFQEKRTRTFIFFFLFRRNFSVRQDPRVRGPSSASVLPVGEPADWANGTSSVWPAGRDIGRRNSLMRPVADDNFLCMERFPPSKVKISSYCEVP
jgi:hypothetical protein